MDGCVFGDWVEVEVMRKGREENGERGRRTERWMNEGWLFGGGVVVVVLMVR